MPKLSFNPMKMVFHLIKNDIQKLEYDPKTQWVFHRRMSWYWVMNFPVVGYLFFYQPKIWIGVGLLLNTFYSLYANFATDYGAVPASYAAMIAHDIQEKSAPEPEISTLPYEVSTVFDY